MEDPRRTLGYGCGLDRAGETGFREEGCRRLHSRARMARLCGLIDCLARPPAVTGVPRVQTWVSGQGKIGSGLLGLCGGRCSQQTTTSAEAPQGLAALLRAVFS